MSGGGTDYIVGERRGHGELWNTDKICRNREIMWAKLFAVHFSVLKKFTRSVSSGVVALRCVWDSVPVLPI